MTPASDLVHRANEPESNGSVIELHTLGNALIKVGEKEIRPSAPLLFAALLYLGMERGRRVPRSVLQELLFPEASERSGAHSLRQLLYKLRRLGVPVKTDDFSVLLRSQDVVERTIDTSDAVPDFDDLRERSSSGVLPGYAGISSPPFQEWLAATRSSIEAHTRRSLQEVITRLRHAGQWTHVESLSRALLRLDPLNEIGIIRLAEALASTGSKRNALRVIDDYRAEIGVEQPNSDLVMVRQRIAEQPSLIPILERHDSFCGRESELVALGDLLHYVKMGSARVAVVSGEAGIGKTRLLQELASIASLDGFRVEWCHCSEHSASRSSEALSRTVANLLRAPGALGVSPTSLALLKRLTETSALETAVPWTSATESEALRVSVDTAVRDLVECVGGESPLVIVVEDAHWIDASSLQSLLSLADPHFNYPLLLIFTTRRPSLTHHDGSETRVIRHRLRSLADSAAEQIVRELLDDTADDDFVMWAVQVAGGNPFFLRTISNSYRLTGTRYEVPSSVKAVVRQSIDNLDELSRELLEIAALLGGNSSLLRLQRAVARPDRDLLSPLRDLEVRGLVRQHGDWVGVAHDLLVDELVSLIPPASKQVLHGIIAEVLDEETQHSRSPSFLWDCAEHWRAAGKHQRSLQLVLGCVQHLVDIGEPSAAYDLLLRAKDTALDRTRVAQLTRTAAVIAFNAGRHEDARREIQELRKLEPAARPLSVGGVEFIEIEIDRLAGNDIGRYVDLLFRCVSDDAASSSHRLHAAFLLLLYADATFDDQLAERTASVCDGISADDANDQLFALSTLLIYHISFGDILFAPRVVTDLARVIQSLPLALTLRHRSNWAMGAFRCGQIAHAVALLSELVDVATSLKSYPSALHAAAMMASLSRYVDYPVEAEWKHKANALVEHVELDTHIALNVANLFYEAIATHDTSAARQHLNNLKSIVRPDASRRGRAAVGLSSMEVRMGLAENDMSAVSRGCERLLAEHEIAAPRGLYDDVMEALYLGLSAVGDRARAEGLLMRYLESQRRDGFPPRAALLRCAPNWYAFASIQLA